jgi:hypothetical protein
MVTNTWVDLEEIGKLDAGRGRQKRGRGVGSNYHRPWIPVPSQHKNVEIKFHFKLIQLPLQREGLLLPPGCHLAAMSLNVFRKY